MAVNQIRMQDLDKIIQRAKQGNNWQGIVYTDDNWKILVNITACTIEFAVKVQYKNGKFGMDRVVINSNEVRSYTGQLKLPIVIQNKIQSIFKRFTESNYFTKPKSTSTLDTTYVESDDGGHTISLKACQDILVPNNAREGHDYYEMSPAKGYTKDQYSIHDIIQDKNGTTYMWLGCFSEFRFWKPRAKGKDTKTGLPGENSKYIINVNYDGKFIYLPITSPETLKLFRKSTCYGIVKNIEQQVKELNTQYIKELAHNHKIEMVRGFSVGESDMYTDCADFDYENGIYTGRQDKNILGWKWKYDPYGSKDSYPEEFGEWTEEEERPIHW